MSVTSTSRYITTVPGGSDNESRSAVCRGSPGLGGTTGSETFVEFAASFMHAVNPGLANDVPAAEGAVLPHESNRP
jgi:hypothetical protein